MCVQLEAENKLAARLRALESRVEQFEARWNQSDHSPSDQLKRSEAKLSKRMTSLEISFHQELQLLKQDYHKGGPSLSSVGKHMHNTCTSRKKCACKRTLNYGKLCNFKCKYLRTENKDIFEFLLMSKGSQAHYHKSLYLCNSLSHSCFVATTMLISHKTGERNTQPTSQPSAAAQHLIILPLTSNPRLISQKSWHFISNLPHFLSASPAHNVQTI